MQNKFDLDAAAEAKALADRAVTIGLLCGAVADAVFPHNHDHTQRQKLAMALVELVRAIAPFSKYHFEENL